MMRIKSQIILIKLFLIIGLLKIGVNLSLHTTRKNGFNEGLFLHYSRLKPPLSYLFEVSISFAKPSLKNMFARIPGNINQ